MFFLKLNKKKKNIKIKTEIVQFNYKKYTFTTLTAQKQNK